VAVAEELNFSRAAERLHMAQPPLSVAIRQLEQELGTALLTRTTRDVRLTDAGSAFLEGARATLAGIERTVAEARRAAAGELGRLRIAFSWGARFVTLPALGQAFHSSYPDVQLRTEEMWNSRMADALESRAADLAVSLCAEIVADVRYEAIRSEPLIAIVTDDHPLAAETEIALAALAGEPFVMFPRELAPRLYESLVGVCRRAGFEPQIRSESFHASWELGVLADVPAVALAPESVMVNPRQGLVAVALSPPAGRVETAIMWREEHDSAPAAAFREVARGVFAGARVGE
jgi:DNA-binding transcriptional LysR family regulator